MRARSWVAVAMAVGLILALPSGSAGASGPPVGKIYDCWNFDQQSGFNNWVQSVELSTSSTYMVGDTRKGSRLVGNVAKGRYRARGRKLTFTSGPYAIHHLTAVYKPAGQGYQPHKENELDPRFDVYEEGENILTCYLH